MVFPAHRKYFPINNAISIRGMASRHYVGGCRKEYIYIYIY